MLTGRRAGPVLALTLAMLTLGGCRWFVPAGSYQKDGLSFDHLRGWTVKKDLQQKDVRTVIVEGPYHALFVISVFGARVDVPLETFAKSMARVRSETTKKKLTVAGLNLGAEGDAMPFLPTERSIAGQNVRGLDQHFIATILKVPIAHTVELFSIERALRTVIVMDQVANRDRLKVEEGFQKIFDTVAIGP